MTTFQVPCGCLLSMDGDMNEPCLVHQHEQITPKEAMVVFLRQALMDESPDEALAFIRAARSYNSGGQFDPHREERTDPES